MDHEKIALEVLAKVSGHAAAEIEPEMTLVGDLGLDSPQALSLLIALEDALEIEIPDEAAAVMESVEDVLSFVRRAS